MNKGERKLSNVIQGLKYKLDQNNNIENEKLLINSLLLFIEQDVNMYEFSDITEDDIVLDIKNYISKQ